MDRSAPSLWAYCGGGFGGDIHSQSPRFSLARKKCTGPGAFDSTETPCSGKPCLPLCVSLRLSLLLSLHTQAHMLVHTHPETSKSRGCLHTPASPLCSQSHRDCSTPAGAHPQVIGSSRGPLLSQFQPQVISSALAVVLEVHFRSILQEFTQTLLGRFHEMSSSKLTNDTFNLYSFSSSGCLLIFTM